MASGSGPSRAGLVLVVALLVGLSAAFLLQTPPSSSGIQLFPNSSPPALPNWVGPALLLIFFGSTIGVLVARRLAYGSPANALVSIAYIGVLAGIIAYVILHFYHPGGGISSVAAPAKNTTTKPMPPTGGGLGGGGALPSPPGVELYLVYALVIGAAIAAAFLIPRYQQLRLRRSESPAPQAPATAVSELSAALERLRTDGAGDDARTRIIRAYGALLGRVAPGVPTLETETPREIAEECARVYRIRPATARELTSLFEAARYGRGSALPTDAVDRAEAALRQALAEAGEAGERRR